MVNLTHKQNSKQMENAIARARQVKPGVKYLGFRAYSVSGSTGNLYRVSFSVNPQNGTQQAHCSCKAGEVGQLCFHVVAAFQVHVIVQGMRVQAKRQREAKPNAAPMNYGPTCGALQI